AIAAGNIGAAASKVESILGGLLSLAISFLAGFVGLGKVTGKVMEVINKVRSVVDKALDTAIGFIIGKAKALFARLFSRGDKKEAPGDPNDVRTKVKNEAASKMAGQVDPAAVPGIIKDLRSKYQKDGLKSLTAIEISAGEFDLDAVASPGSKVGHFTIRDFGITRPRTGLLASVNGQPKGRWRNSKGVTNHAERKFLRDLPGLLPPKEPGKKVNVVVSVMLTRSPCGECAGALNAFKASVAADYNLTFSLAMMTLYKGGAEGSIGALEALHAAGNKLSVATIDQILENKLYKDEDVPADVRADIEGKTAKLAEQIKRITGA